MTGYGPLKTDQSYRRVPLTAETTDLLRDYLAQHPRRTTRRPLWPGMGLTRPRPTGVRATPAAAGAATTGVEGARREPPRRPARDGRQTPWRNSPWRTRRSGWCSTGPSRCATRRSTRPSTGQRCCGPTGDADRQAATAPVVPRAPPHVRESVRRGGDQARRSSAAAWATPTYGRRWTCTCTCSPTTTRRTIWPLLAHCPHRSRRTAEMLCRYTVLRTSFARERQFTIRPSLRCGGPSAGVTLAVAPPDRQRCDQPLELGPQPVSSDRHLGWREPGT